MTYLPSEAAREELLRDLAGLISSRGSATFLGSPIVEPSPRFLPDAWEDDLDSASLLLRRLMLYAGLDLDADLHLYDREDAAYHPNHIAWFAGIEEGRCRFGLDVHQLDDPQSLVAAFCHEIAHAWREHHEVVQEDRDKEEELTDLTTIYLGFGILTTNATDRYQQSGYQEGGYAFTESRFNQAGYLSPQAMSFLFAAQLVARGLAPSRCKAVARQLETNQAEYLTRSVRHLAARREELLAALGLPPDVAGPDEPDLAPFTRSLEERGQEVALTADPGIWEEQDNETAEVADDWEVYALREGIGRYVWLAVLGAMFGSWLPLPFLFAASEPDPAIMGYGAVAGCAGALLFLGRERRYKCTDSECGARIRPGDEVCPGCGARVAGRIRSKDMVFADEE
jgi:hypothetical protein